MAVNIGNKALAGYLVSLHRQLNPTRERHLNTTKDIMPSLMSEVYKHGTAKTPDRTVSTIYQTNPDLFERSKRGYWRLTKEANALELDHDLATRKLIAKIKKDDQKKIDKLILEANDDLSKKREGTRRTATRTYIARSSAVRELALIFHGNKCAVCGRSPKDFGAEYNDSMMEVHHTNELHTYEEKGITETDIRTDTAILCAPCHRCNVHLSGSMSASSIEDAKAHRASFVS